MTLHNHGQGGTPNGQQDAGQSGDQQQGGTPAGQNVQVQGPNDPLAQQGQQGGAGTQGGTQGTQQQDGQPDQYTELREALRKERELREAAERKNKEFERQGMSDDEKKRLSDLETRDAERDKREKSLILRYEIAAAAPRLGIVDPEVAVMLIERDSSVTVGDDGKVAGLDEALKALVKAKPHLVNKGNPAGADGGAGTSGASGAGRSGSKITMNDLIRRGARGQRYDSEG